MLEGGRAELAMVNEVGDYRRCDPQYRQTASPIRSPGAMNNADILPPAGFLLRKRLNRQSQARRLCQSKSAPHLNAEVLPLTSSGHVEAAPMSANV